MKVQDISQATIIVLLVINLFLMGFLIYNSTKQDSKESLSLNCKYDSDCSNGLNCLKETLCEKNSPDLCIQASYCKEEEKTVIPPKGPLCGNGGCEIGETMTNCPEDCQNLNNPDNCDNLEKQIVNQLNNIRTCSSDSECTLTKTISLPCTIYICDVAINKGASIITINQMTKEYWDKGCENGCPGAACDENSVKKAVCLNNKCTVTYTRPTP